MDATEPPSDFSASKDTFASINSMIVTTTLLGLICIGYLINTGQLRHVPESGAAMACGFAMALAVRFLHLTQEEELLNFDGEFFFYILLPPIIFENGFSLKTQMFIDNFGAILALAVVGTFVSTLVVSVSLRWAAEFGLVGLAPSPHLHVHCYLFGALISATDPVATMALFGSARFRTNPIVYSLLNGESVLNDAVAIVLFHTLSKHMNDDEVHIFSPSILGNFILISLGSVILGLVAGAMVSLCFCRLKYLMSFPDYEISAMCLSAYLTFAFAQLIGLSGIVALFFFGMMLAQYNWYNLSEPSKVASKVTFGTFAKVSESCVFVYLGAMAALSAGRFHWHFGLALFSLLVITVARAAHVFPLVALLNITRAKRRIDRNMTVMMWASGLRGAIAFALALRIPCSMSGSKQVVHGSDECRNSDLLVTTTMSIVVVTTLGIGTMMERLATLLQMIEPTESPSTAIDMQLMSPHAEGTLSVPLAIEELPDPYKAPELSVKTDRKGGHVEETGAPSSVDDAQDSASRQMTELQEGYLTRSLPMSLDRGVVYQAFARFDLRVLQPVLGGPRRSRVSGHNSDAVELPDLQSFTADPGLTRFMAMPDEDPPAWSRSVIFE